MFRGLLSLFFGLGLFAAGVFPQPYPNYLLDTIAFIGPDCANVSYSSVAFADNVGIVIWRSLGTKSARLSPTLVLLDTISIPLQDTVTHSQAEDVCTNGISFLTAFVRDVDRYGDSTLVAFVLTKPSGQVMKRGVLVPASEMRSREIAVGSDGQDYLVVWSQDSSFDKTGVYCSRINHTGVILDTQAILLCTTVTMKPGPDVAGGPEGYAVVWRNDTLNVKGAIVQSGGGFIETTGFVIPRSRVPTFFSPRVSHLGQHFVVVWPDAEDRFLAARVSAQGRVVDSVPAALADGHNFNNYNIASAGDTMLLVWTTFVSDSQLVVAQRFDADLYPLDTGYIRLCEPSATSFLALRPDCPSVCAVEGGFVVTWSQMTLGYPGVPGANSDIVARRVTSGGVVPDSGPVLISRAANEQDGIRVASDGNRFLAVWTDFGAWGELPSVIRAALLQPARGIIEPGIKIVSPLGADQPWVAYGRGEYLIVWRRFAKIEAVRMDTTGRLLDSVPITVSPPTRGGRNPTVAWSDSGELFLVTWWASGADVRGARVRWDGVVLDSSSILFDPLQGYLCYLPNVASDGKDFFVTFGVSGRSSMARRLLYYGKLLDSVPIKFGHHGALNLTYGAGIYLPISRTHNVSYRVSPEGVLLDSLVLPEVMAIADLVYDGSNFLLVGGISGTNDSVVALRISPDGILLDSSPVTLTYAPEIYGGFAVGYAWPGWVALLFPNYEPYPFLSLRLRYTFFPPLAGVAHTAGSEPAGGFRVLPTVGTGLVHITATCGLNDQVMLAIYSVDGRRVKNCYLKRDVKTGYMKADLRTLPAGVYWVRLRQEKPVRKLVIAK